jgi:hypothetical protein
MKRVKNTIRTHLGESPSKEYLGFNPTPPHGVATWNSQNQSGLDAKGFLPELLK